MREPAIAADPGPLVPDKFQPGPLTMRSVFAATVAIIAYVGVVAPKHSHRFHERCAAESSYEVAKVTLAMYVDLALPRWAAAHRAHACPTLYELDPYMPRWHEPDPWGHEYFSTCADGKIYVGSLGEDGKSNTADDIWSHQ